MTTLADMILASARHRILLADPGQPGSDPDADRTAGWVPIVVADAVAEFFFAGTPQEDWEFSRDFRDCTPPLSPMFVEMARPAWIFSGTWGLNDAAHLPARWGWRFEATPRAQLAVDLCNPWRGPVLERHYRSYADTLASSGRVDVAMVERALDASDPLDAVGRLGGPDGGYFAAAAIVRALDGLKAGEGRGGRGGLGWLLHGVLILERDGRAFGPAATLDMMLDHAGRPMPPPLIDVHGGGLPPAAVVGLRATILPLTFPALLALSFMNNAGVTLGAVEPSPDLARRHAEQGLPAPVRHLVMDIGAVADTDRN